MDNLKTKELKSLFDKHMPKLKGYTLCIICNLKKSSDAISTGNFNYNTEYLSDNEYEQVTALFAQIDIDTEYFINEDEFINYYFKLSTNRQRNLIVYNAAQSGTGAGRKSLIPAFCNLHNIICTGSDAYVVSLCRQKFHVNKLLESVGLSVPKTYFYFNGWVLGSPPRKNEKVIIKPIYESASIGIGSDSVVEYSPPIDKIISKKVNELKQPFIAQKFISGYEVENPVVIIDKSVFALPPVGLSYNERLLMGDNVLDYDKIFNDDYGFFDFKNIMDIDMDDVIKTAVDVLNMYGLCRIDYRIDAEHNYYITDVSTNPHFIDHSSVHHSFLYNKLCDIDIVRSILTAAIVRRV